MSPSEVNAPGKLTLRDAFEQLGSADKEDIKVAYEALKSKARGHSGSSWDAEDVLASRLSSEVKDFVHMLESWLPTWLVREGAGRAPAGLEGCQKNSCDAITLVRSESGDCKVTPLPLCASSKVGERVGAWHKWKKFADVDKIVPRLSACKSLNGKPLKDMRGVVEAMAKAQTQTYNACKDQVAKLKTKRKSLSINDIMCQDRQKCTELSHLPETLTSLQYVNAQRQVVIPDASYQELKTADVHRAGSPPPSRGDSSLSKAVALSKEEARQAPGPHSNAQVPRAAEAPDTSKRTALAMRGEDQAAVVSIGDVLAQQRAAFAGDLAAEKRRPRKEPSATLRPQGPIRDDEQPRTRSREQKTRVAPSRKRLADLDAELSRYWARDDDANSPSFQRVQLTPAVALREPARSQYGDARITLRPRSSASAPEDTPGARANARDYLRLRSRSDRGDRRRAKGRRRRKEAERHSR
jgi:hypothetical protein